MGWRACGLRVQLEVGAGLALSPFWAQEARDVLGLGSHPAASLMLPPLSWCPVGPRLGDKDSSRPVGNAGSAPRGAAEASLPPGEAQRRAAGGWRGLGAWEGCPWNRTPSWPPCGLTGRCQPRPEAPATRAAATDAGLRRALTMVLASGVCLLPCLGMDGGGWGWQAGSCEIHGQCPEHWPSPGMPTRLQVPCGQRSPGSEPEQHLLPDFNR